jgi:hypothetical protein
MEWKMSTADWNTADGKRALQVGKEFEGRLFSIMCEADPDAQWIANDPERFFDGYDMIFRGKRVEVKSNAGVSAWGKHYDTVCVEVTTKAGRPIGWSTGKSDVVVFIDRSTCWAYVYRSSVLREWIKSGRTFSSNDAQCIIMPWICKDAGFVAQIAI